MVITIERQKVTPQTPTRIVDTPKGRETVVVPASKPLEGVSIDTDQLEAPKAQFNLPEPTPQVEPFFSPVPDEAPEERDPLVSGERVEEARAEKRGITERVASLLGLGTREGRQAELQTGQEFIETEQELTDIQNEIRETQLAFRREREDLQTRSGLTARQRNAAIAERTRKHNSSLADLEVIRLSRANKFNDARAVIDRKVTAEFADRDAQIKGLEFMLENNEFNKLEERQFQEKIAERKNELDAERDKFKALEESKLNILFQAKQNGAGNSVLQAVQGATDVAAALEAAGKFGIDMRARHETELARLRIRELNSKLAPTGNSVNPEAFPVGSPERAIAWIQGSKGNKGKLTQGQLESFGQIQAALGGTESLLTFLGSISADGGDKKGAKDMNAIQTGRASGRAQNFLLKLKGNPDVAGFNAAIQGLIPTVARGIFGEVGVLTEADIDNYKQTLPTLKNTQEENAFIATIMLDVLSRSMENLLVNSAKNQTDVSNFEEDYVGIKSRVDGLKDELATKPSSIEEDTEIGGIFDSFGFTEIGDESDFKFNI